MNQQKTLCDEAPLPSFTGAAASPRYQIPIYPLFALAMLYIFIRGVIGAVGKPLWYDELVTLSVAGQPNLHFMWVAISRAFDSAPPGFYLIEHFALALTTKREIALRLPSILAFACTFACIFVFVRKRSGDLLALLTALLLFSTTLFQTYSIEARGYSMVVACIAFALLCYQHLPSKLWTALLGLSFLLAESFHYYAIFAMVPFGLAELVLLFRTRRIRWTVWLALACGLLPLILFWPFLWKYKSYYSGMAFLHPAITDIPVFYGSYFFGRGAFGIALAAAAAAVISRSYFSRDQSELAPKIVRKNEALAEGTLILGLIALPVIVFVLVRVMHGGLLSRYGIAATLGIVLAAASALSGARPRTLATFAVFVLASAGAHEAVFWLHSGRDFTSADYSAPTVEKFISSVGHEDLPVAVGRGLLYAPLAYYSPQRLASRLFYLVDHGNDLNYGGTDTLAKGMPSFPDFFPHQIVDYSEFAIAHREFLFYEEYDDPWQNYLSREASSVQLLASDGGRRMFLVKVRESPTR